MDKHNIDSYKELKEDIELCSIRVNRCKKEIEFILSELGRGPAEINGIDYSNTIRGSMKNKDMARYVEDIARLENKIFIEENLIKIKEKAIKEIDEIIMNTDGLKRKVVVMRDIERKTLKEIADELGYSYIHIRKIYSKYLNEVYN